VEKYFELLSCSTMPVW